MKVFMIGGTGLLGSAAASELIRRGHEVKTLALPPLPEGAPMPAGMRIEFGNYLTLSDEQVASLMAGCDGFVFAAGVDERLEGPPPIYDLFKKYNITPLERLLRIAKESGVKHSVICGSYFAYFDREWPELALAAHHPYIRSRVDQAKMAHSFVSPGFDVAVLELPYIFGAQPGRKPVWVFLVEQIKGMEKSTMYPNGGTTMVTVKQVGQAMAGALELCRGAQNIPVGYYNMTWREMLAIFHKYMGTPDKKITTIPNWMYKMAARGIAKQYRKNNIEGGLNPVEFAKVMCSNAFIEKDCIEALGVEPDDIDAAIGESVTLSLQSMRGAELVEMRGE